MTCISVFDAVLLQLNHDRQLSQKHDVSEKMHRKKLYAKDVYVYISVVSVSIFICSLYFELDYSLKHRLCVTYLKITRVSSSLPSVK